MKCQNLIFEKEEEEEEEKITNLLSAEFALSVLKVNRYNKYFYEFCACNHAHLK